MEAEGHARRGVTGLWCTRGRSQDRAGDGEAGGWACARTASSADEPPRRSPPNPVRRSSAAASRTASRTLAQSTGPRGRAVEFRGPSDGRRRTSPSPPGKAAATRGTRAPSPGFGQFRARAEWVSPRPFQVESISRRNATDTGASGSSRVGRRRVQARRNRAASPSATASPRRVGRSAEESHRTSPSSARVVINRRFSPGRSTPYRNR